ncbi:MAG: tetratricopeptide repeat protein [Rhodospirillaceae bacterium]|nr:tetratricopeptide repeat protein [Rhodospirillaceae bacterium]
MIADRQGNPVSGATAEAVQHYDQGVERLNIYRGDPLEALDRAIDAAPDFVMAHLAKAHMLGLATEPQLTAEARSILGHARTLPANDREGSHIAVLDHLLGGNWDAAATAMDLHNVRFPRDLVALQCGHLMDFYRANARDLRDRIARALPHWSSSTPGHAVVLGMYSFGLEETGDYAKAEEVGRQAIDLQPLDCWAHHAVAHVMEMQGRAQDGIGWMIAREPYWSGDDNFFKVHNWWHRALYHLDLGEADQVLALYDGPIREDHSAVVLDLVDASALLWRLHLTGHAVGDRWVEVAEAWDGHADGASYPFNDWHAVMAYLGAGRDDEVERIRAALASSESGGEVTHWARSTGLPLVDGFVAFWRGDYAAAVSHLHPARFIANRFGGSHAQRDIIDWTLTEAALRGGQTNLAEALANERLALKPHSPLNRDFLRRARPH